MTRTGSPASLAGLPAVNAGPFVVAGWHELAHLEGGKIPVWIEAGPAFGTGHHGTTKGCLEALALELKRKRAAACSTSERVGRARPLAAVKYGAGFALGTDMDKESPIRIAKENAKNNQRGAQAQADARARHGPPDDPRPCAV